MFIMKFKIHVDRLKLFSMQLSSTFKQRTIDMISELETFTRHWAGNCVNCIVKNPKSLPEQADFYKTLTSVRQTFGITGHVYTLLII